MAGHTVLLIDDDSDMRQMLTRALGRAGYQVLEVADGQAAVRLLQSPELPTDVCVVLLDLMLPKQSGLSVLEAIGPIREVVPVIAMSGNAAALRQAADAGASETIEKPFVLAQLLTLVNRCCARL